MAVIWVMTLLAFLAAAARRLGDIDKSPLWLFAAFIPFRFIGSFADGQPPGWRRDAVYLADLALVVAGALYLGVIRGTAGENSCGPDPREMEA